jgi:dTDP-4-amino-4,6-dideoxygalactose transaminase
LNPVSVINNITPQTKAIISADIFGHVANNYELKRIADEYGLKFITDSAQSPGVYVDGRIHSLVGDVGGFSLNYHKHIHTGEGGVLVTNDDQIAERLQLIRNHAEAVVGDKKTQVLSNMIGSNFRLGEIEAAIGIQQLKKLKGLVEKRSQAATELVEKLSDLDGLRLPITKENTTHAYYMFPMILDIEFLGVSREKIKFALENEGLTGLNSGYANIHLLPMYQRKIAYGSNGFPWTSDICKRDISYAKGICPIAESLHDSTYLGFSMCLYDLSLEDINNISHAFHKVWGSLSVLKDYELPLNRDKFNEM